MFFPQPPQEVGLSVPPFREQGTRRKKWGEAIHVPRAHMPGQAWQMLLRGTVCKQYPFFLGSRMFFHTVIMHAEVALCIWTGSPSHDSPLRAPGLWRGWGFLGPAQDRRPRRCPPTAVPFPVAVCVAVGLGA